MAWIAFTCLAAFSQAFRNALQSKLSQSVSVAGVTLARFIWACPLALIYLLALYQVAPTEPPNISFHYLLMCLLASTAQILATVLLVILFKQKNYSVGSGLSKCEAPMAAVLGVLFFNTHLDSVAWFGVLIGGTAVMLFSLSTNFKKVSIKTLVIGLGTSLGFSLTSLWVREATLLLNIPFLHRGAITLFTVISMQCVILLSYLSITDKKTLHVLIKKTPLVFKTSAASVVASMGWFTAMSLQAVPLVKTLGQIEIIFTLIIAFLWLKERPKAKDIAALILTAIAAILVML
ncbi:MAG: hypothetical protein OXE99_04945 [Cellvibrionales bacterium]|nr:hypothetical protein [Cellvibrionales bacterium]